MLLSQGDPDPVQIDNPQGGSPFLLIGDHAGNAVPASLSALGLEARELRRHIGWDIGVAALGRALAVRLDAMFIHQAYSRLVIDCNRAAGAADAIAPVSDGTAVPGNQRLSDADRAARVAAIYDPYHHAIGAELARRDRSGSPTILVALHSFTPVMRSDVRPWQVGVLHDGGDSGFALAVLDRLRAQPDLVVGDNQPYRMDMTDYSIPRHAYPSRRPYVELEVRQDILDDDGAARHWAERIAPILTAARAETLQPQA